MTILESTKNSGSWNYTHIMHELDKQSNKKIINIPAAGETYNTKNSDFLNADEL
jgi:hypothetical protein